jgi:hypothetical protein
MILFQSSVRRGFATALVATSLSCFGSGVAFADDPNPDQPMSDSTYVVAPHMVVPDAGSDSADLPAVAVTDSDNPAVASPNVTTACDQVGTETWEWANQSKPWQITHAENYENYGSSAVTRSESVEEVSSVTASVSFTTSTKVSTNEVVAQAEENMDLNLQASGARTKTTSITISGTQAPGTTTAYYAGVKHVSAHYDLFKCASLTKIVLVSAGNVNNWAVPTQGVVACNVNPPASSLAYAVKHRNC